MAAMIGRTRTWLFWLVGGALALVFGEAACSRAGEVSPSCGSPAPPTVPGPAPARKPLVASHDYLNESPHWVQLALAWGEAEAVVSRRRGIGRCDQARKNGLLAGLAELPERIRALKDMGLLSDAEADLLRGGVAVLRGRMERVRVEPVEPATCYLMSFDEDAPPPVLVASRRLALRLPLAAKLAGDGRLHPAVARKIAAGLRLELAGLEGEWQLNWLEGLGARGEFEATRTEAERRVEELEALAEAAEVRERSGRRLASAAWLIAEYLLPGCTVWPEPRAAEEVRRIGQELAAEEYQRRQLASQALARVDASALRAVRALTRDPDLEVAERARQVIPDLEMASRRRTLEALVRLGADGRLMLRSVAEAAASRYHDARRRADTCDEAGDAAGAKAARDQMAFAGDTWRKLRAVEVRLGESQ